MTGTTLDLYTPNASGADGIATDIATKWQEWNNLRNTWLSEKRELRNYVFATDTRSTTNATLPWKNSTTIPKLCQIRDNLHANYISALFPHADWLSWEGADAQAEASKKRQAITDYMNNKADASGMKDTVGKLIYDWIDYGNIFATLEWVDERKKDETTGEVTQGYTGPKLLRISPEDIVFNPTAPDFKSAPKIVRSFVSIGELQRMIDNEDNEDAKKIMKLAFDKAMVARQSNYSTAQYNKQNRFMVDGFGTLQEYYSSGLVELLTFYGDFYDVEKKELLQDQIIVIADRNYLISSKTNPSWLRNNLIFHSGWRERQDNLYAMGPLDNLVGMQYRIDHLENLKADAFDMIAFPVQKVRGYVEDYEYGPGERIYVGDEGDVTFMSPDVTVLNADTQIAILENKMEEMAGAPKQAMGFRTPGEKTAFEVQTLENAANRVFLNKTAMLEKQLLEPALNAMLELARRQLDVVDTIRVFDNETSAILFQTITKEDITANGRLVPRGASRFARKSQMLQNLNNIYGSALGVDPAVNVHISGKETAKMLEELLEYEDGTIVQDNIRIIEQGETVRVQEAVQRELQSENAQVTSQDEELL